MDENELKALLARQNEEYRKSFDKRYAYLSKTNEFYSILKDANFVEFELDEDMPKTTYELLVYLANEKINNKPHYDELIEKIEERWPDFNNEKFIQAINDMEKAKYEYFKQQIKTLSNMLNDYNRYFSDTYKKRIFDMAEKGVFVLFETYPIFEDYLIDDVDTNIRNIFNFFKKDNYQKLYEFLDDILEGKHSENYLQAVKTQEFEDALFCLKNEKYSSCARTMIALIENDHENASNLNADLFKPKATKGIKRAEAITKQVNDLGCEFLSEGWKYLNSFYEKFYINTENRIDGFLNRHDIVHGHYEKALMPNDEWCLKLVFFYMSFKHISFLLQEIHDMYLELEKDLKVLFANKKSGK